ncbi:uncharacterized protein LOC111345728 [Stylophora pistillata]|nr:uncharacterized protein LOC111345728 [Stylophora pistillata]
MPNYVENDSTIALFADDSKLYHCIDSSLSHLNLQADIDGIHNWSIDFEMEFSTSKCKVLQMSKKRNPTEHTYYLSGNTLEPASQAKDLGVTVHTDLSWKTHIELVCTKANKLLGLVKRFCRDIYDTETRKLLYGSMVRPHLEYASNVWSPYMAEYINLIENFQRRATKFILNYPPSDISYTERLVTL